MAGWLTASQACGAGIMYHDLVNAVRKQIPASVSHIATKVTAIAGDAGTAAPHAGHGR